MKSICIEKNNKKRRIVVYDEFEKLERIKLKNKLENNITFADNVYSFVKKRSIKDAIDLIVKNINNYNFAIKCDIYDFFNTIDKEILLEILQKHYNYKRDIQRIKEFLDEEEKILNVKGIALGSPLSPILSNIYLMEFDKYFTYKKDIMYFRFCDDLLFLTNKNIINEIIEKLAKLKLKLSLDKTGLFPKGDSFVFLGYHISTHECKVVKYMDKEKGEKIKEKGYFSDESLDLIGLINCIKHNNKEKFMNILMKIDFNNINDKLVEKVIKNAENLMGLEYAKLIEMRYYNKGKEEIIEELIENNNYNVAARFEEIFAVIKLEIDYPKTFKKIFDNENSFYFLFENSKQEYIKVNNSLTEDVIDMHIKGNKIVAIRLDKINLTSKMLVFDVDCDKNLDNAYTVALKIKNELKDSGYNSYIEFSGKKGYHVWVFFDDFYSVRLIEAIAKQVLEKIDILDCVVEIKPKENILSETENCIKLPQGIHPTTLKRSSFIDINDINEIIKNSIVFDLIECENWINQIKEKYIEAYKLIKNCDVLKSIILKGLNKKTINHFDRLLILYTFSFIEKGKEFIHYYMSNFENYSYNITEKYISKAPDRPISCKKIKEYLKDTDLIEGCHCKFEITEGFYPTPVLHSEISSFSNDSLIIKARGLFKQLSDLKTEKEQLERKIKSIERKLDNIFTILNTDEIDIEIGKLKRNNINGNKNWTIEVKF